jgi:hypothetical protein
VRIGFLVLHGNDTVTAINLSAATFADGNPRVGRIQPGRLRADSLCFQVERLIDARGRFPNALTQNSPNPFNPTTTIRYSITEPGWTRLIIFDILGRVVEPLVEGWREAGEYEVTFNASQMPSGVYFYRLETGSFSDVKKMLLTK